MSITTDERSLDAGLRSNGPELALSDGRKVKRRRRSLLSRAVTNLFRIRADLRACSHIVWQELCSLVARIAIARKNNWYRSGTPFGSCIVARRLPRRLASKYRLARIRGIQLLRAIHPEATQVDVHILLTAIDPHLFQDYLDTELGARGVPSLQDIRDNGLRKKGGWETFYERKTGSTGIKPSNTSSAFKVF